MTNGAAADGEGAVEEVNEQPEVVKQLAQPVRDDLGTRIANHAERVADGLLTDGSLPDRRMDDLRREPSMIEAPRRDAVTKRFGLPVQASPLLSVPRVTDPKAIALFVPGGAVRSSVRMRRGDPSYLRMVPFARDVELRSHGRIGGAVLRLAVRGWNDPEKPAVSDAHWALDELRCRYPDTPIALVGHSLGGRVALEVASEEPLDAVVALAPWAADEYEAEDFGRTPMLIVHGRRDMVTDPKASADIVERITAIGGDATFVSMPSWHAMLYQAARWHKTCSRFLMDHLLDGPGVLDGHGVHRQN